MEGKYLGLNTEKRFTSQKRHSQKVSSSAAWNCEGHVVIVYTSL